ncbi:hypothetical protein MBLNU230_g1220t1 [Neophaeotheca triangularis]
MPSTPPRTKEDLLATGTLSQEYIDAQKASNRSTDFPDDLEIVKEGAMAMLPYTQKALADSRPEDVDEKEIHVPLSTGFTSRCIILSPKQAPAASPLIVLFYGGGFCLGYPETQVTLARALVQAHNAVVVLPSYRLAPESPFPAAHNDGWAILQHIAACAQNPSDTSLPSQVSPSSGFIIAGESAGCNIATSLAHLARDNALSPPLTGLFYIAGSIMSSQHVPPKYQPLYLSREQNATAPILNAKTVKVFYSAFNPDHKSPLWASFDQHNPRDAEGEVMEGLKGLPPVYFQVCGADPSRDDGLIFEKVLREEVGIATRLDLYAGWPHCWWSLFPQAPASRRRLGDSVEGVGWLLEQGKQRAGS